MQHEFKVSMFNKISLLALAAMFGVIIIVSIVQNGFTAGYIIPILLYIGAGVLFIGQLKRRIIITGEAFIRQSIYGIITIPLNNIAGYRIVDKGFKIYYGPGTYANSIRITDTNYSSGLMAWVRENLTDLDQQDREVEYDAILAEKKAIIAQSHAVHEQPNYTAQQFDTDSLNPDIISTETDTTQLDEAISTELDGQFEKYRNITIVYDMVAGVAFLACLVSQNWVVMAFMIVYPLIGLALIATSKGLLRICYKQTSPRYSLFIGMIVCAAILALARIPNEKPFLFYHFLPFALAISVGFIALAWYVDIADRDDFSLRRLWLPVIGILYGFGTMIQLGYIWGYFIK